MSYKRILSAVNRASPGIAKYLQLMQLLHSVDVSRDAQFQTLYKGFYRVQRKPPDWYGVYFSLMQQCKGSQPEFSFILNHLRGHIGNNAYEPSFSSKLVATLNPWKPIWDKYVLRNTGHTPPSYTSRAKHSDAVAAYASIVRWYEQFMRSKEARRYVSIFNEQIVDYYRITDIKKVDFILWQLRDEDLSDESY
jgi:hypothetical protein